MKLIKCNALSCPLKLTASYFCVCGPRRHGGRGLGIKSRNDLGASMLVLPRPSWWNEWWWNERFHSCNLARLSTGLRTLPSGWVYSMQPSSLVVYPISPINYRKNECINVLRLTVILSSSIKLTYYYYLFVPIYPWNYVLVSLSAAVWTRIRKTA